MGYRLNQLFVLSGLFFIISSFFTLISSSFKLLFAFSFPIYLIFIVGLILFKPLSWVSKLTKEFPNIALLLNVLGIYTIVYFVVNFLGIVLEYFNECGLLVSINTVYGEWNEPFSALVDILFFVVIVVSLIIIMVRKFKR